MIDFEEGMLSIRLNTFSSPSRDHSSGSTFIEIFIIAHFLASDIQMFL
jgi:hypothetical protein